MKNKSIQIILEAFKSNGFLVINNTLINKFGLVEAAVLSNYINKYMYFQLKQSNFNGWFFLRHKDIANQLNIKEGTVIRIKKQLVDLDILSTKMRGAPAKEWIQINFDFLSDYTLSQNPQSDRLDPLAHGGLDLSVHGGLLRRLKRNKIKEEDIVGDKSPTDSPPPKKIISKESRNEKFLPLAQYLHEIISTSKKIKYNANQIKSWADEIRKLSEMHTIDPVRIKRALRWYKSNVGGQYIPVIESGYSLRMKFIALEAAKERQENPWEDKKKNEEAPDKIQTVDQMRQKMLEEMTPEEKAENIEKYGTATPWFDKKRK